MSYESARSLLRNSVSRPTLYSVELSNRVTRGTNDYINFFCSQTSIPEVRHNTIVANGHEYMGIVREQPTSVMFGKPFGMTIIENSDFSVYKDLRNWFDLTAQGANQEGANRSQRMNYSETYVADITITKLEQSNTQFGTLGLLDPNANYKKVMKVTLLNAYPINIGEVSLDSTQIDQYTTFQTQFTYESYTVEKLSDLFGQIRSAAGAIAGLF